jgi:malate/lactate dehydrogenase
MSENGLTQYLDTRFGYTQTPSDDPVNSPAHYNTKGVEAITAIEASMSDEEFQGYCKGNAMKYLWRYKYKGKPVEDLKKAQWYLEKLIASVQNV